MSKSQQANAELRHNDECPLEECDYQLTLCQGYHTGGWPEAVLHCVESEHNFATDGTRLVQSAVTS